jgi:hypothetical protein
MILGTSQTANNSLMTHVTSYTADKQINSLMTLVTSYTAYT